MQTPSLAAQGKSVGYAYDLDNRLAQVSHPDGAVTQFAYDKAGNRVGVARLNAQSSLFSRTSYAYDVLNRLTDLVNLNGAGPVVSAYHYVLNPDGKRASVTESGAATK